jgi:hypothetical protein
LGRRYTVDKTNGYSEEEGGRLSPPYKLRKLLDGKNYFERSKPQYEGLGRNNFLSVLDPRYNVKNDMTGSATNAKGINKALEDASRENKILVFPAGMYVVEDTINVPVNTKMVGVLWSQIMATGSLFQDEKKPKVLIKQVYRHQVGQR